MEATRRPPPADPDFDASPPSPVRLRDFDPLEHQRLVVNPFLAVLALIASGGVIRGILRSSIPPLAVCALILLIPLPYLVHYHCLDCGKTGPYPRRGRHACPGALARWHEGSRPRLPIPSARSQLVIWGWFLGAVALILAVWAWE